MTILWDIWRGLGKLRGYAAAALAGVAVVLTMRAKWRKDGRDDAKREASKETDRRVAKGAKGAQQARDAQAQGRAPEDGVRSRDGRWK